MWSVHCIIQGHCARQRPLSIGARLCSVVTAAASNEQPACACTHARLRHCALWKGGAAGACGARAPRRAGRSRSMQYKRALHQPDLFILSLGARQCSDVLVVASNEHPTCACAHTQSRHCALSLWGGGAGRVLAARARRAALVGVAPCTARGHCTSERPLSFGARPCFDVLAVASHVKQAARLACRKRHCALSLLGGGPVCVVAARARSAAWVVVPPRTIHGLCTSKRPLSYGARAFSGVPAAAINAKHPPCLAWRRRHCALSLSGGGVPRALAARARRAAQHANRCIALL